MGVVRLRGPLRTLAGGCGEHTLEGATVVELLRALERGHPALNGLDPRRAGAGAPPHQRVRQRRARKRADPRSPAGTGSRSSRQSQEAERVELAGRDQEGAVHPRRRPRRRGLRRSRLAPSPASRSTSRRGSRRTGRCWRQSPPPSTAPRSSTDRRRRRRRVGAGRRRRAARGRRAGARAHLGDHPGRGTRNRVRRRGSGRAVRKPRRRGELAAQRRVCGVSRHAADWQPGGGGLCLHSICPWPGDPQTGSRSRSRPPACG